MGYTTREFTSSALSKLYPAYYKETQIHNWSPVDVAITFADGKQTYLPRWEKSSSSVGPYVEVEVRETNGLRIKESNNGRSTDIDIPAKQYVLKYEDFLLYPVKIEELGIIVSTKEHSLLAKNMTFESGYCPEERESLADFEMKDPRFVFEVKDPYNRWEHLYLNVLGQTVTLSCGHRNHLIGDLDEETVVRLADDCTLSCYLRYPSNYAQMESDTVPVFTINLKDLDLEEPYCLPSGDIICVASSLEALQRVLAKKGNGQSTSVQITGMVSKEIHDQAIENLKSLREQDKESFTQQMRSAQMKKDAEIADLKFKLDEKDRTITNLKQQVGFWDSVHQTNIDRQAREDKLTAQREKTRDEIAEAARKSNEATMNMLKIGITAASGIISLALTLLIKSAKK